MENMEETKLSTVNDTLYFRIHDFKTNTDEVTENHIRHYPNCSVTFSTTVFPAGVDKDTEGFLVVRVRAFVHNIGEKTETFSFNWAVSVVDVEGNSRFTQYSENFSNSNSIRPSLESVSEGALPLEAPISVKRPTDSDFTETRYLKKSFILERADEFLSDGDIFVRCDFYVDFEELKKLQSRCYDNYCDTFKIFISSIPQVGRRNSTTEPENSKDNPIIFDFTAQVLTLPQFHESRKKFGVYGIPPVSASESNSLEPQEDTIDILDHIWIFDTQSGRFLLSLAPIPDNVGHLLVNASRVIRQCVDAPMKEQRENRVEFHEVDNITFFIVLHFLESGEVKKFSNRVLEKVYQFSHLYEMEKLQQKCARYMTRNCGGESEWRRLEEMAELYSDEYLFLLLQEQLTPKPLAL